MAAGFAAGPYHLSVIAETGDRFADFAPYVAAIDDGGVVVFSAALTTGGSGVFRGDGTRVATVADSTPGTFQQVSSHPDIDGTGSVCFYAEDAVGGAALHWSRDGEIVRLSEVAGPLGPTMNSEGTIGFRAPLPVGGDGIFTWSAGVVMTVADTNSRFSSFHGLPVVDGRGCVVFRADRRDGSSGIWLRAGDRVQVVAEEGHRFSGFGHFPFTNRSARAVMTSVLTDGTQNP